MSRSFDETTLSAFVDGALDTEEMMAVDALVEVDLNARQYVWEAFKTKAQLQAALNPVADEKIPQRLRETIGKQPASANRSRRAGLHFLQAAAAVLLLLAGAGMGWLMQGIGNRSIEEGFESLPARYSQVVDAALEHNLSGNPTDWQPPRGSMTVKVTPVRTFKDADGRYYREYTLEVSDSSQHTRVSGLAYRTGQGRWRTKAMFF